METHVIKLADGTKLTAELNGNNYVVDKDVAKKITADNIATATIDDVAHAALVIDSVRVEDGKTWIVVHEQTQAEKDKAENESNMAASLAGLGDLGQIISDLTTSIADIGEKVSALEGKETK